MWPFRREPKPESVPLLLPEPLASEVDSLLAQGRDVAAVKRVRAALVDILEGSRPVLRTQAEPDS